MASSEKNKGLEFSEALEYTQKIVDALPDPIILLHEDLKIAVANQAFYQLFGIGTKETEGQFLYELANHQWDVPMLRPLLEDILPRTTSFDNFEIEQNLPGMGQRTMLLNACRIYLHANSTKLIILTMKDITERKQIAILKSKIKELESLIRGLKEEN